MIKELNKMPDSKFTCNECGCEITEDDDGMCDDCAFAEDSDDEFYEEDEEE